MGCMGIQNREAQRKLLQFSGFGAQAIVVRVRGFRAWV